MHDLVTALPEVRPEGVGQGLIRRIDGLLGHGCLLPHGRGNFRLRGVLRALQPFDTLHGAVAVDVEIDAGGRFLLGREGVGEACDLIFKPLLFLPIVVVGFFLVVQGVQALLQLGDFGLLLLGQLNLDFFKLFVSVNELPFLLKVAMRPGPAVCKGLLDHAAQLLRRQLHQQLAIVQVRVIVFGKQVRRDGPARRLVGVDPDELGQGV